MQAALEGPLINQGRLEAPLATTNTCVYAITKKEAVEASTVVIGPVLIFNYVANVLFDSGATHSFVSISFSKKLDRPQDSLSYSF